MTDRLDSIKRSFNDAEAAGRITLDSPTRWLIAEVERLRSTENELRDVINTLRSEREAVVEELARRYGAMFASPTSEPATTQVFRDAQVLADQRLRRTCSDV